MRQAGRYMSVYRELRKQYTLLDLCRTPDLATEVTMQPVRAIELDAAILFSDLLLPLEPMGIRFDFIKGEALETPVYYIDNENECIAARTTWKCSYLNKYSFPGYDGNLIVDAEYENEDVMQIKSKATKIVTFLEL